MLRMWGIDMASKQLKSLSETRRCQDTWPEPDADHHPHAGDRLGVRLLQLRTRPFAGRGDDRAGAGGLYLPC
jgi:hypothetical protein